MAGTPNRVSTYSNHSSALGTPLSAAHHSSQVSTTTLLNTLHTIYTSSQPYRLDASTSLVVNTWLTASPPGVDGGQGGTVDGELGRRAWEHARRRAEDGCVMLGLVPMTRCSLPHNEIREVDGLTSEPYIIRRRHFCRLLSTPCRFLFLSPSPRRFQQ